MYNAHSEIKGERGCWTPAGQGWRIQGFYHYLSQRKDKISALPATTPPPKHKNTQETLVTQTASRLTRYFLSSVQFSCSVASDSLWPHESEHARPPCPSPTPGVYPNPCASSRWCHQAISSSVIPFSSCPQSLPASESFPMSQLFTWGGQSIGVSASASVLPMNTQDWFPLGWTGWISLQEYI